MNPCGCKCVWTYALIFNFHCYFCMFCEPVAVFAGVNMCRSNRSRPVGREVWCLQQENCHKQSAPASVKRQAWENWLLYMLQATPRSLNKATHLPNAMTSKWAVCFLCVTPGWQESRRDTGRLRWALTMVAAEIGVVLRCGNGPRGVCSYRNGGSFRFQWFHAWTLSCLWNELSKQPTWPKHPFMSGSSHRGT